MKIGIIGDIHGNLSALEAVIEDAETHGVDSYDCLGDIVGYGPEPSQCIDQLQHLEIRGFVQGNFDHVSSESFELPGFGPGAAQTIEWTRRQLTESNKSFLRELPLVQNFGDITLVHASLDKPTIWEYVLDEPKARNAFKHLTTQMCFYGHTHVPLTITQSREKNSRRKIIFEKYKEFILEDGERYLVNPGSVGQPRDGDPRASYIIYDDCDQVVQFRRIDYDIEKTQKKMRALGFFDFHAKRLEKGA